MQNRVTGRPEILVNSSLTNYPGVSHPTVTNQNSVCWSERIEGVKTVYSQREQASSDHVYVSRARLPRIRPGKGLEARMEFEYPRVHQGMWVYCLRLAPGDKRKIELGGGDIRTLFPNSKHAGRLPQLYTQIWLLFPGQGSPAPFCVLICIPGMTTVYRELEPIL